MTASTGWLLLVLSGLLDVGWAFATKKADGFANVGWTALSIALLAAFVIALTKALSVLPLGMAYAVWTGIGAVGSVVVGVAAFHEPLGAQKITYLVIIVSGIIGLNLDTGSPA
ncbi:quaternary ammonium compound-resistance protein SugE [Devosia sp. UYZn731]|uniref:DMT family transporter n=1 Tax=Devosia sp. UYZn731 TaxID=3156345 RepID=UPI00339134F6